MSEHISDEDRRLRRQARIAMGKIREHEVKHWEPETTVIARGLAELFIENLTEEWQKHHVACMRRLLDGCE